MRFGKKKMIAAVAASVALVSMAPSSASARDDVIRGSVNLLVQGSLAACANVTFSPSAAVWQGVLSAKGYAQSQTEIVPVNYERSKGGDTFASSFQICTPAPVLIPIGGAIQYTFSGTGFISNGDAVYLHASTECHLMGDFLTCTPVREVAVPVPPV